jgi:aspartate racemase
MKTIGLIGGMSWQSTLLYYRLLNEGVQRRLGGSHSAKLVLANVEFHEIEACQKSGDWNRAAELLVGYARAVEAGGADFLLIGANTMHKVAPAVEAAVRIPLLHVADVTGAAVVASGGRRAGLLGTRFTMEQAFYRDRLMERQKLPVVFPAEQDRAIIHRVIYEELCHGETRAESRAEFRRIIGTLVAQGADSLILGCTEISLLIGPADSPVPVFDTLALHAAAAVERALA